MTVEYLSTTTAEGAMIGATTGTKLGFFGTTPIARPTVTAVVTTTATTTLNERKVDRLYAALRALGLIA